MKKILTHKSRTFRDIVKHLERHPTFTFPSGLLHYRYEGTKKTMRKLRKLGLTIFHNKHDIHVTVKRSPLFEEWLSIEEPRPNVIKWVKEQAK